MPIFPEKLSDDKKVKRIFKKILKDAMFFCDWKDIDKINNECIENLKIELNALNIDASILYDKQSKQINIEIKNSINKITINPI